MPLVQSIFNKTMLDMGQEVSNNRKFPEFVILAVTYSPSVHSYPLLASRSLQHRRGQATANLRRCHESSRQEPRLSWMRTVQTRHRFHSL